MLSDTGNRNKNPPTLLFRSVGRDKGPLPKPPRPLHVLETDVYPHPLFLRHSWGDKQLHTVQRLMSGVIRFLRAITFWNSCGSIFARWGSVRTPPILAHNVCCMLECSKDGYVVFQYSGNWLRYIAVFLTIFTPLTNFLYLFQVNVTTLSEKK